MRAEHTKVTETEPEVTMTAEAAVRRDEQWTWNSGVRNICTSATYTRTSSSKPSYRIFSRLAHGPGLVSLYVRFCSPTNNLPQ
jgi:hypothetical protein